MVMTTTRRKRSMTEEDEEEEDVEIDQEDELEGEGEEDDEEDEDNSDEDGVKANGLKGAQRRRGRYDIDGLHNCLEMFAWADAPFSETLTVSVHPREESSDLGAGQGEAAAKPPDDVNDDLGRELFFYEQALEAGRRAIGQAIAEGLPFQRPADYYAEMVKSDQHMEKVKRTLLEQKKEREEVEKRKKQREQKKFGKAVQARVLKERAMAKTKELEAIQRWRSKRSQGEDAGDLPVELEDPSSAKRSTGERTGGPKTKKRRVKDQRFGFGGPKKLSKQNDRKSLEDPQGLRGSYRPGKPQGGKKKQTNRPGSKIRKAKAAKRASR